MTKQALVAIGKTKFGHTIYEMDNVHGGSIYFTDESGDILPFWNTDNVCLESMRIAFEFEEAALKQLVEGF